MTTLYAKSRFQRTICATLASVVTIVAIAVSTLASRPYILPGQTSYSTPVSVTFTTDVA